MLDTNKQDKEKQIQELEKWGTEAGYKLGFLAGAMTFGVVFGLILGAISILKHSKNELLENQTETVKKRAQTNQISLKDLEKLSSGKKISSQKYIKAAIFIDGLENKLGSLDSKRVGNNFTFTKTVNPSGLVNYIVENKNNQVVLEFDLNQDGIIAAQSRNETKETSELDEFFSENASKISVDVDEEMGLYSYEISETEDLEQKIGSVKPFVQSLQRFKASQLATGSNAGQQEYNQKLQDLNDRLFELKTQAKSIQSHIDTVQAANENENQRHPENTWLGIKASNLVDKLAGLDKQIDSLQADLEGNPQTVDRQETKSENTAPTQSTSDRQPSRFPPPLPSEFNKSPQGQSFSEEAEYPDLPADLNQFQAATSPANGQPITIVETEAPDYVESQGIEQ
jgi:hypothetical protein